MAIAKLPKLERLSLSSAKAGDQAFGELGSLQNLKHLDLSSTTVAENDEGATVATLSATDVDDGDTATFSISDDASGLFEVVGNELKLNAITTGVALRPSAL